MGVAQDRASGPVLDGPVDRPPDGWRERHQDRFGALADYAQHPVAVLLPEVLDV
jgi:hypothetical protein